MNDQRTQVWAWLRSGEWRSVDVMDWHLAVSRIERFTVAEWSDVLSALRTATEQIEALDGSLRERLQTLLHSMKTGLKSLSREEQNLAISETCREHISHIYNALHSEQDVLVGNLLQILAESSNPASAEMFVELLITRPPLHPHSVALAMASLFEMPLDVQVSFFPRILDGLQHLSVAASILDLANFLFREKQVRPHPAACRSAQLGELLGQLAQRLEKVSERPNEVADSPEQLSTLIAETVSLGVSLCDALALIGDEQVVGKIYQVLEVEHRRLQTEAAWALAKLDEEEGRKRLIALAAEPVVRLRVLHYADELDLLDDIETDYRGEVARAEAELASWLAEPTQFGLAPRSLELVDQREMYWPGFDERQTCYLFRFSYEFFDSSYSNVGLTGPLTHAFAADLADLPPDDIYAVFAGYSAEHASMRQVRAGSATGSWAVTRDRLVRRIEDEGYENVLPEIVGDFFGEELLVAVCRRQGTEGIAVADRNDIQWRAADHARALGAAECFYLYTGRKLLSSFNP